MEFETNIITDYYGRKVPTENENVETDFPVKPLALYQPDDLPQWMKDAISAGDYKNFAKFIALANKKYIDICIKPVRESIKKSMEEIYKNIVQYDIGNGRGNKDV